MRVTRLLYLPALMLVVSEPLHSQPRCSFESLLGTYAFRSNGVSTIITGDAPGAPIHWAAATAPIAGVGQMTIRSDRTGTGFYWIEVGSLNSGLTPIPFQATFTWDEQACSGTYEYPVALPGSPPVTVKEAFVSVDAGRELRAITVTTAVPTAVWVTTAKRIANGSQAPRCRQNQLTGSWLIQCNSIESLPGLSQWFGGASLFRYEIAGNGSFQGSWTGKLGPVSLATPVAGSLSVEENCSLAGSLVIPSVAAYATVGRGVLVDDSRELWFLPIVKTLPFPTPPEQVRHAFCIATAVK